MTFFSTNGTKIQKRLMALCVLLPVLARADLSNTATATYKDVANNPYSATSNSVVVTVFSPPTMTLTKTATPTSAKSGDVVTFTIQYQNTGGSSAANVVITDNVPVGSVLNTGTITGGGTAAGGVITWNLGTMAVNATGSVSFQVTVK